MHKKSVAELSRELESGKISSVELTREFLDRIKAEDGQYNSFITVTEDLAMADAKAADEQRAAGNASVWTGVPFAHKDIFCTNGVATTAGSKMLANFVPPYDATVVANFRAAGAVCLGKTNMDEFAMGSSTESSFFGPVTNPWGLNKDEKRVPGGSSGGSAAAIAARLVPAATATDTGGSIRQPAALCGVTGLKPTYGRVSRYGMIAFASSLDQGGTMARTAEDNALMLNVMAGFDPKDSTSANRTVPDYTATLNQPLKGLRVGLPKEYFSDQLNPAMEQQVRNAVKEYEKLGATVKEVSLPHAELAIAAYYVIAPAEASANLSRFDGVRYGYRCDKPQDLNDLYTRTRAEGFGNEVKRRILVGTYALSAGYFDAYYLKAQKVRRLIQQDFINAFKEVDVLMSPVSPSPAFVQGEKTSDPVTMYLEDIFTIAVNLAGVPAMSVPAGFVDGLPVGLQIIGNYFEEARLLNAAHQFQQVTGWHQKFPQ
ncbi:Asp-tRNA(Asn)/Glu-tRNA(Gln) amidotransferase subunit GatA [Marinobacter psychrophilus]|jgi:aspartyl-tRNA(Asn)/glutamyl-tRNA(Gln) amidotransferase subunit A|uniref:Asp-tRNA(Asn)/Glu-tRNA(Gln) amidotransferase subunit GatA n=1 Tax=Marinobacter psychrophilus TaxID=330734 RepID=UPI001B781B56|nr:Asp-tRNA(Asn)/Glu-tRNA(Gln) amidotransferase subunit GatA [Marinobacter psychrophilus]MBQ0763433.1 Asp-tRNA(Asn)/Glu-tRNA(Gln) amidotransferase subunit GatA [Marinobacter psychrophilus]MBQ0845508.1 Asp-tRNA(Asn)/Glu-tRNA(Gln) amidotransferase subunit GatA [Marinobacter psychrophilus]